jgi:hypothetical protein
MTLQQILEQINPRTAQSFVTAARHLLDALLIEAERVQAAQPPTPVDYDIATLSRAAPPGGWLGADDLRAATQRLSESIAVEKWVDGVLVAIRTLNGLGV